MSRSAWNNRSTPNGVDAATEIDVAALRSVGCCKPASLVKLLVVGNELFRHNPEHSAVKEDGGTIEQPVFHGNGQADDDKLLPSPICGRNLERLIDGGLEERACWPNRSAQV